MALITEMISKDTLTYGEIKGQPYKPHFIVAMQKEISDHKHCKHWKLVYRSEIKGFGLSGENETTSWER